MSIKNKWKNAKVGIPVGKTAHDGKGELNEGTLRNRKIKEADKCLRKKFLNKRTAVVKIFFKKETGFNLDKERTSPLNNFRNNRSMVSIMKILEWAMNSQIFWYYSPYSSVKFGCQPRPLFFRPARV